MKKRSILIVDDEQSILTALEGALSDEGFTVLTAEDGFTALKILERKLVHIVLLDIWMESMDGIEVLKRIKSSFPKVAVVMMSGHGNVETAVKATKLGAYNFIEKPLSLEKLMVILENLDRHISLEDENYRLKQKTSEHYDFIGKSKIAKEIKDLVYRVAPTNSWVLITGENGTGKELVAKQLHQFSQRSKEAFIEMNCAAIPENLIESELFGHERGAFTGAHASKKGRFDLADGGTLFLDEIGDMSLHTQAKILRILQEQKFERVGGNETIHVDVRVIAATNKNLKEEIHKGNFREDLYYRLNVIPFHISPLRERKEDIRELSYFFLERVAVENHREKMSISVEALKKLCSYNWPGNIRELKNLIERFAIMTKGSKILESDVVLPASMQKELPNSFRGAREQFEKHFIENKLKECYGNISKTAKAIGVERSHLHRKIKQYGIKL